MVDILKREKEFQKLNEELDKKTKSIIEKSSNSSSNSSISAKHKVTKNTKENREIPEKDESNTKLQKANTIPKRFRDLLTNRKTKEPKEVLEVIEKSLQNCEVEFSNEISKTDSDIENIQNASLDEVSRETIHEEEQKEKSGNDMYEGSRLMDEIKQKIVPKANTVPKRLRDSLTTRKIKNNEVHEVIIDSFPSQQRVLKETHSEKDKTKETCVINKNSDLGDYDTIKQNKNVEKELLSPKKGILGTDNTAKKSLSGEGLVKYLKSKVSILEVELSNTRSDITKQIKELERSYETQQKLEAQRDHAISKNNTLTEQNEKIQEKLIDTERKLKTSDFEIDNYKRDLGLSKRENKVLNQTKKNLEKRLFRSNEEVENFKSQIDSIKNNERNSLETCRIEKEKLEKQVKELKRQRNEFLNAYKKQLFLIDNLKRQNVCMEQCQVIGLGEKQFSKLLDLHKQ